MHGRRSRPKEVRQVCSFRRVQPAEQRRAPSIDCSSPNADQSVLMAKSKRMSDVLTSSAEKNTLTTATPPYSSEGPTLPLINGEGENAINLNGEGMNAVTGNADRDTTKKRKLQKDDEEGSAPNQPQRNTNHPGLYEPWTLLPREILGPLMTQARLANVQNAVSIVFTKNQNIRSGIMRLRTYFSAHVDEKNQMEVPEVLKDKGFVIAISAQGEGTAKLVTIVDMARRIVKPDPALAKDDKLVETWRMYMSLASVEVEQKKRAESDAPAQSKADLTQEVEEEDAFEPMEVDVPEKKEAEEVKNRRKVPVLTVWMSRREIPAFKEAFGEQTFAVQTLPKDD